MTLSRLLLAVVVLISFGTSGCASQSSLPQTAAAVDFGAGKNGKMGWSSYREEASFPGVTFDRGLEAAKAGLGAAHFSMTRYDPNAGVLMGEHSATWRDWNVVAAVYMRQEGTQLQVVVLAEGSKDIGFTGDTTSDAWTAKILKGMRDFLVADAAIRAR